MFGNQLLISGPAGVYKTGKGILEISDNLECPICLEINRGVSQPNCEHTVCIECFKRCYYGDKSGYPVFPYSEEIMNEWENDEDSLRKRYTDVFQNKFDLKIVLRIYDISKLREFEKLVSNNCFKI